MSNENENTDAVKTSSIPAGLLKSSLNEASFEVYNRIGDGLKLSLEDKNDPTAAIIFESIDSFVSDDSVPSLAILSALGSIEFHNYGGFLQALSGINIDQSMIHNDELTTLMIGRLPQSFVRPFSWLAPLQNVFTLNKDKVTVAVRLLSKDISVATFATASAQLWSELFSHNKLKKIAKQESKPVNIPMSFPCHVGSISITPALFRSIEAGDVVFFDQSTFDVSGRGSLDMFCKRFDVAMSRVDEEGNQMFSVLGEKENLNHER